MKNGLLMTLIAAAISFTGATASFAAAPTIGNIPNVIIGDKEDNIGTDNNLFVFTNAFQFDSYAFDSDTTPISTLLWSFDEDSATSPDVSAAPYFSVNGKAPIHVGATALSNDVSTSFSAHVNPVTEIRAGTPFASFRDVVFSPGPGNGPFSSPLVVTGSAGVVSAHALGKMVRFYASDGSNVAHHDIMVSTVDNTSDSLTQGASFTVVQDDTLTDSASNGANANNGWGVFAGPVVPTRNETNTYDSGNTALLANITSDAGNWATFGWITTSAAGTGSQSLTYAGVGTGKVVRAKFFMYATGQTGAALNQIPSLRMRVANRFAITSTLIVITNGGSAGDALDQDIAPVKTPLTPSVYKVDLDPPDTPRLVSNASQESFLRAYEIYDNSPQVNGTIAMTEGQIGTYPATAVADAGAVVGLVTDPTGLIKSYSGPAGDFGTNASANVSILKQKYTGGVLDGTGGQPNADSTAAGIVMDSLAVETDRLAVAGFDNFGGTDEYPRTTATRQISARVEPGKMYLVKFHMTATKNSNTQCLLRLRAKSLAFSWTSTLEIAGIAAGGNSALLGQEFEPGVGNALPAADRILGDTTGGWYRVIMQSPMDTDIKASQPALAAQDPPGVTTNVASNSQSRRDIQTGVDLIDDFTNSAPVSGQLTVDKIQIHKLNAVN